MFTKSNLSNEIQDINTLNVNSDDIAYTTGLEILVGEVWLPTERELWRAWTGQRRVWGIEYHGPVYNYMSSSDAHPYTGRRLCSCDACQAHVLPVNKPN